MTEEIVEMGAAPKKNTGRAMTVIELRKYFEEREAQMKAEFQARIEELEHQEHHCDCPNRIIDMAKELERLDRLDDNDELLRQGINKSHAELAGALEKEHRLRADTEQELKELRSESAKLTEKLDKANIEVSKYKKDVNWLGVLTGAVLGVGLVVIALSIAGLL